MAAYSQEDLAGFAETIRVLERARTEDQALIAALTAEATQAHANNARLKQRILELEGQAPPAENAGPPPAAVEPAGPAEASTPAPLHDDAERSEFDGALLTAAEGGSPWLVFLGRRHEVVDPAVFEALFTADARPSPSHDLHRIPEGPPLRADARLVRAPGTPIYLARNVDGPLLHHIQSWEAFQEFGFDIGKVREVPNLLLDALPRGPLLTGARTR